MTDKPEWQPLRVSCLLCRHDWGDWQPSNVRIAVWVAAINALRCQKCGAGAQYLRLNAKAEAED